MAPDPRRGIGRGCYLTSAPFRTPLIRALAVCAAAFALVASAGCGSHDAGPTPVKPGPPTVSCPAPVTALAHNGALPQVTYTTPTAQGGQGPVTTVCTPASGSTFQLGMTTVTCTATDSLGQNGACSFAVTVNGVPRIALTKFMAFGDSMTAGTTSPSPTILLIDEPGSYPSQLAAMLSSRYVDQTITMVNEGKPGQFAAYDSGRFKDVMAADRPEVVLLMHGANDLLNLKEAGIAGVLSALEDMIHEAKRDGAIVFLATLPPQNPAGSRGGGAAALPDLNAGIRATAADESVTLVDLYAQMGTYVGYIGVDGLHPTTAGYTKIAEIWRDAIEAKLELPPATPPPSATSPVRTTRPTLTSTAPPR